MMKKFLFLSCTILFTATSLFAQAPDSLSYQVLIRDHSGSVVASSPIGIDVQILQGTASGTVVYEENQTALSNANGLVSIMIGNGTTVSGSMKTIDWNTGPYFIKTQTDPAGGTVYSIISINQILSVPYALHAAVADSVSGISRHYVTEKYGGGIVFYVYDNGEHGLIAATSDQSAGIGWNTDNAVTSAFRDGINAGKYNTAQINTIEGANSGPALICANYTGGGFGDWYLPSAKEAYLLGVSGVLSGGGRPYWSSTGVPTDPNMEMVAFVGISPIAFPKTIAAYVRAIRSF